MGVLKGTKVPLFLLSLPQSSCLSLSLSSLPLSSPGSFSVFRLPPTTGSYIRQPFHRLAAPEILPGHPWVSCLPTNQFFLIFPRFDASFARNHVPASSSLPPLLPTHRQPRRTTRPVPPPLPTHRQPRRSAPPVLPPPAAAASHASAALTQRPASERRDSQPLAKSLGSIARTQNLWVRPSTAKSRAKYGYTYC